MPTVEFKPELFNEDTVTTEKVAYELLKATPVPATNYFAAPWSALIRRREMDLPRRKLDRGFTICQHAWFDRIIPACLRLGLDTLFTPHVQPGTAAGVPRWVSLGSRTAGIGRLLRPRVEAAAGFRILPFPHLAVNGVDPQAKELWYSFIGFDTHPVRRAIFDLPRHANTILMRRQHWHFDGTRDQRDREQHEYRDTLARSRYSLCPRGYGPSTIRFWESLQAGAIPVLISDAMILPTGFEWARCVVRIAEAEVTNLEPILADISDSEEERLRENGLRAFQCFSGANLVRCVRLTYSGNKQAA